MEQGPSTPTQRRRPGPSARIVPFAGRGRIAAIDRGRIAPVGPRRIALVGVDPVPIAAVDPVRIAAIFEAAYATHAREIHLHLLRSTRDLGVAEDLTQEAFLRLCRELRAGRTPDNIRAWLYRVAANLAASRGRHLDVARRWLDGVHEDDEDADDAPEPTALRRDRHVRLERALAELPRDTRAALLMAASGFSGHEIAEALGRSDVATRTLLFRARLRLRASLEEDDERVVPEADVMAGHRATCRAIAGRVAVRNVPEGPRPVLVGALRSGHD